MSDDYIPTLTLDAAEPEPAAEPVQRDVELDEYATRLTEAERKTVEEFAQKINLNDTNAMLMYGSAAQKKIADFSESALSNVRTKDMGEIGGMLTNLVGELKGFAGEEQEKGIFGFFKRTGNQLQNLKTRYDKAEANVDKIVAILEGNQMVLMKDIAMLDRMYQQNLNYFKELSMYVIAGQKRLEKARGEELPALRDKAERTGLAEDAQAANDYDAMINRFEKKLHDLKLTRIISLQMGPQIRLIQNSDTMMVERIQSSIVSTIPLWKNQMVLALGMAHTGQAIEAQRRVTDMTNELLKKNAQTLKQGAVEAAKESERGIVDVETLTETNRTLIETLDEVVRIQREGSAKRGAAELELGRIEGELKQKLLELRG